MGAGALLAGAAALWMGATKADDSVVEFSEAEIVPRALHALGLATAVAR